MGIVIDHVKLFFSGDFNHDEISQISVDNTIFNNYKYFRESRQKEQKQSYGLNRAPESLVSPFKFPSLSGIS